VAAAAEDEEYDDDVDDGHAADRADDRVAVPAGEVADPSGFPVLVVGPVVAAAAAVVAVSA